jgi:hypothetical protein
MFNFKKLDYWGIWLSLLCLAHCLLLPAFLMALPILARYYLVHPFVHFGLSCLVFPVAILSLWSGYRVHLNKWVLVLGILGALLIVWASLTRVTLVMLARYELYFNVLGSLLLMVSHLWNIRSMKICRIPR